ncbi:hypothetical protein ACJX0J_019363, partial [Zea mays]
VHIHSHLQQITQGNTCLWGLLAAKNNFLKGICFKDTVHLYRKTVGKKHGEKVNKCFLYTSISITFQSRAHLHKRSHSEEEFLLYRDTIT